MGLLSKAHSSTQDGQELIEPSMPIPKGPTLGTVGPGYEPFNLSNAPNIS